MDIIIFPALIIVLMVVILLIGFFMSKSRNTTKQEINPALVAGALIFLVAFGFFFLFIFGISSSGSMNIAPFIPIFGGAWIPIWIAISAQKKKESKLTTGSQITNEFIPQRDEIKSIRFCPNCGGQYQPSDRYCEMCGQSL
jgi:hypothetical protein